MWCAVRRALVVIPDEWEVIEGGGEGLLDPKDQATLRENLNCVAGENVNPQKKIEPSEVAATYLTLKMFEGALNGFTFPADTEDFNKWETSVDSILVRINVAPPSKEWSVKARYDAYKVVIGVMIEESRNVRA